MKNNLFYILVLFSILFFASCKEKAGTLIDEKSFYYWQTVYNPDSLEMSLLQTNNIKKLYIRYFDVDVVNDNTIIPSAPIQFIENPDVEVIPVVFITNRSISALQDANIEELAANIVKKINSIHISNTPIHEIQIDCDWSKSTRKRYFDLLHSIKSQLFDNTTLSVTIRLHQIKFPDITGIPPVDRGVLMVYNVSDISNFDTNNSIFDSKVITKYTDKLSEYPLHLDVAFPIFRQEVMFRNGKFVKALRQRNYFDISHVKQFKRIGISNRFECVRDTFISNTAFLEGDVVRVENVNEKKLKQVARYILKELNNADKTTFIYFDLNTNNFNKPKDEIPTFPTF